MGEQVPALPGRSHAWHWPSQATLQQTPSTQVPEEHWLAPPQLAPRASTGAQRPPAQNFPGSLELVQYGYALQIGNQAHSQTVVKNR